VGGGEARALVRTVTLAHVAVTRGFFPSLLAAVLGTAACAGETHEVKRLDGSRTGPAEIEARVSRLMSAARVPGLAIAILNGDDVVYLHAFGYRNVAAREPLTVNTAMAGASFTKVVFAHLVMQLVEERRIDLDRPVHEYLGKPIPQFAGYRDLAGDERWRRITARMLLSHTSGFPNWRRFTDDGKLRIFFEPGSRFAYSGEGIDLLQLVVEQITGRPAGDLIQERVFDRFSMRRTGMVWRPGSEGDFATGYDEAGKPLGHERRARADAAGSMNTTISDFARFLQAVVRAEGMAPATKELMLGPQVRIRSKQEFPTLADAPTSANDPIRLSYGLGWGLFWTPYGKAFFKEGHDDGWENHCVCFDEKRTCAVLMSNSLNADGIFKETLEILIGDHFTPWYWENYIPYQSRRRRSGP